MSKISTFLITLSLLFAMNSLHAADKGTKTKDVVEGKVSVVKVDTEKFSSVKIKTDSGEIVNVTLDDKGKEVGKNYDAIRVYVKGKLETKSGEKWITVAQIGEGSKKKK